MNILIISAISTTGMGIRVYYDHLIRWFINNLPKDKIKVKFIVPESVYNDNLDQHLLDEIDPVPFLNSDVEYVLQNNSLSLAQKFNTFYRNGMTKYQKRRFVEVIKKKTGSFVPDIVLSRGFDVFSLDIIKTLFPMAMNLNQENAIFSRPPFERTMAYDPYGSLESFYYHFAKDIKDLSLPEETDKIINEFKHELRIIIDKHNKDKEVIKNVRKKFRKTLLLPLVGTFSSSIFKLAYYESEYDLVEYVMDNVPKDIGVFITEHDSGGIMTEEILKHFRSKYPNFIYLSEPGKRGFFSSSLNYMEYVDAVLNTTSKTALMATLWDKPIVSLAYKCNDLLKDIDGVENIETLWTKNVNKNHILHWYLTRYALFEKDYCSKNFLYNFLEKKLEHFRKYGYDFNFYDEVNEIQDICNTILEDVKRHYKFEEQPIPNKAMPTHKVYNILGIKFKFRINKKG